MSSQVPISQFRAGDKLGARRLNQMVSALRNVQGPDVPGNRFEKPSEQTFAINTGGAIPAFGLASLESPVQTTKAGLVQQLAWQVKPIGEATEGKLIGICRDPITSGGAGLVQVTGQAIVEINDTTKPLLIDGGWEMLWEASSSGTRMSIFRHVGFVEEPEEPEYTTVKIHVTQVAHGLGTGRAVRHDGTAWVYAGMADVYAPPFDTNFKDRLAVGIITNVTADEFDVVTSGLVEGLYSLIPGTLYYVSLGGVLVDLDLGFPILHAISSTSGIISRYAVSLDQALWSVGGLLTRDADGLYNLPRGGDGQVLMGDSALPHKLKWADPVTIASNGGILTRYDGEQQILAPFGVGKVPISTAEGFQWGEFSFPFLAGFNLAATYTVGGTHTFNAATVYWIAILISSGGGGGGGSTGTGSGSTAGGGGGGGGTLIIFGQRGQVGIVIGIGIGSPGAGGINGSSGDNASSSHVDGIGINGGLGGSGTDGHGGRGGMTREDSNIPSIEQLFDNGSSSLVSIAPGQSGQPGRMISINYSGGSITSYATRGGRGGHSAIGIANSSHIGGGGAGGDAGSAGSAGNAGACYIFEDGI